MNRVPLYFVWESTAKLQAKFSVASKEFALDAVFESLTLTILRLQKKI